MSLSGPTRTSLPPLVTASADRGLTRQTICQPRRLNPGTARADTSLIRRLPLILATALLATPLFPGDAEAVKSGKYQGSEISFRVKNDKISKLVFTAVNSCQTVGSGELPDADIQTWSPPGRFKVLGNGKFEGSRYVMRTNDFFDIRFYWRGQFRKGKMRAIVQTSYKFYDSESRPVNCYGENVFRAKRKP